MSLSTLWVFIYKSTKHFTSQSSFKLTQKFLVLFKILLNKSSIQPNFQLNDNKPKTQTKTKLGIIYSIEELSEMHRISK